jgi:hypothetical protein
MKPTVYSFNGLLLDGSGNYSSAFAEQSFFPQATSVSVELKRSDNPPVISTVTRQSKLIKLNVYDTGTFTTDIDVLNGYFDTFDKKLHNLVVKDGSNVQWYVLARVEGQPHAYADYVQYSLRVPDPVWQQVNVNSDAWNITATGQQHTITLTGNRSVYPILSISPTSAKTAGFGYMEYRAWYNPQTTVGLKDEVIDLTNKVWNTSTLVADTANSVQINNVAGIGAGDTSIAYDTKVGNGVTTAGIAYMGTEQFTWTGGGGAASGTLTGCTRGVNGTVAATHADNTVITNSKTNADGSDLRLKIQGQGGAIDWQYWLNGYNTSTTQVWAVIDFDPGITLTLSGAMNNSAQITTLSFKQTNANKAALTILATKKNFMFVIGSEIFSFNTGTVVDVAGYKITTTATDARAAYTSSKASHSDGDSVYWLQYVFQLCYGNSALTAPTQDNTKKPVINLTSSTNTSWVWDTNFSDVTGLRGASWKPIILASPGKQSTYYTAKHSAGADTSPSATLADPSTCVGGWISAYQQGTTWRGELAIIQWLMYNGAGFTTFTVVDLLYRYSTDWPKIIGLQYSADGRNWTNCTGFPEATPASSQTWTAGATHSAVGLGATYAYLRWVANGSIASNIANDVAAGEATSVTLVRASANVPQLAFTGSSTSAYQLQCTITNVGTTDYFNLDYTLALNETLKVDCLNKNVIYTATGANAIGILIPNAKRNYWLTIEPPTVNGGVSNGGKLQFDDTGTVGVTITTTYYDRLA